MVRRVARVRADGVLLADEPDITSGPCAPWPLDPACCSWPDDVADWTPQHHLALDIATDLCWRLTAGRYGTCVELIRPCRLPCEPGRVGAFLQPYVDGGRWFNRACGCTDGCHCGTLCSVPLPGRAHRVLEVKLDGQVIDDWKLLRRGGTAELVRTGHTAPGPLTLDVGPDTEDPTRMTVIAVLDNAGLGPVDTLDFGDGTPPEADVPEYTDRPHTYDDPGSYTITATDDQPPVPSDGGACWPTCQNLLLPDSEPDTFSVRYERGTPVPPAGIRAVSALACEIYKQCTGASGCRLPERVKSVTREGVSYDMFDTGEWLDTGLTGLREVDAWLRAVNPGALRTPPGVWSLDFPGPPVVESRTRPGGIW